MASGNGHGNASNQLNWLCGLYIDDNNQSIVIADSKNNRMVERKMGEKNRKVIASGREQGNRLDQLNWPTDVLIDKESNSLLIADWTNRRALRWYRCQGRTQGDAIFDNTSCSRLTTDHERYLYVSDLVENVVR